MTTRVQDEIKRQKSRRRHLAPAALQALHFVMFLAVLIAAGLGVYALWSRALADPRFRMDGETLALAGAVRECPESVEALEALGKRFNGRSLLDPVLVSDIEKAYSGNAWIKKIIHLKRSFPNRMDIELLLRMPAAQVWHENRYWMIDLDGVLLPVEGSASLHANLPEIVGVTADIIRGRPDNGGSWKDEGVGGALGIMRAFWGSPLAEMLPVERVVVNAGAFRTDGGGTLNVARRFEIVTTSGAVVRWGTFNSGDLPGELTSAEKLWHLQELFRREEALEPGVCFDVRTRLPGYSLLR